MFLGSILIFAVSGWILLTVLVWRKGWRLFSLLPSGVAFIVMIIIASATIPHDDQLYQLIISITFVVMVVMGIFGPKRPIVPKSQRKIEELEKKIEELTKKKETK